MILQVVFRKIEYFEKEAFDLPMLCDFQDASRRHFYVTMTVTHIWTVGSCSYAYYCIVLGSTDFFLPDTTYTSPLSLKRFSRGSRQSGIGIVLLELSLLGSVMMSLVYFAPVLNCTR